MKAKDLLLPEVTVPENPETGQPKKSVLVQLANYSELAFIFPAATVVGWLVGTALDRWLHTTWLYLAGLIVGIIAGFVALIRLVTSSDSKT
ncbi:MAG: ATPase [Acidobacteria bacterium]|nr:MAG: ATPase [Acidobacteriota bacterium]